MDKLETEPFGTFALSKTQNFIISLAGNLPDNKIGRWGISLCRKLALGSSKGPFDVKVEGGLNLRLHPKDNRCEKRVICGAQTWDSKERKALTDMLKMHNEPRPFVFLDVGANVGLYSLFLGEAARKLSKDVKLIAVEPDKTNAARLHTNAKASNINITHMPVGIGAERMVARLIGGEKNRGEIKIGMAQDNEPTIDVMPLYDLCQNLNLEEIDVMKIDIEGYDFQALEHFFKTAKQTLWPKRLVIETRDPSFDILDLCLANGYELNFQAGINAVVSRKS